MPIKFNCIRDINGFNGFGLQFSDLKYTATILASTDTLLTVPSTSGMGGNGFSSSSLWLAIFEYDPGSSVFVGLNAAAALPAGAGFALSNSELNPAARQVKGGDVLHFFSSAATNICVLLYSLS